MIAANDVVFGPGDIGRAVDFAVADEVAIRHLNSFNAFLVRPSAIEQVGWFDECFYPAYKEDQDYMYRVRLANMRRVDVPQMNVRHDESMTIRSNSAYYRANETTHYEWNLRYYRAKWGGDVGAEAFTRPFNRAECDVTYWPDSVETIGVRDWDRQSIRSSSMPTEAVSKTTDSEVPGPFHNISDLAKAIWSIRSAAFPKVFLRMDGRGVTRPDAAGAGKVNCQYGKAGPWERFRFEPQRDGTFAIRSAEFPNVYLRLDGRGIRGPVASGAGIVNCQHGHGVWEVFRLERQSDGTFSIASVAFPAIRLRLEGNRITSPAASGAGVVNCQCGLVGPWEKFHIEQV